MDFRTALQKAKLRFHHKLINSDQFVSKIYKKGNYLFDLNSINLKHWFGNPIPNPIQKTKFQWKSLLNKQQEQVQKNTLEKICPSFLLIKPNLHVDELVLTLPSPLRTHLLNARHSFSKVMTCRCDVEDYCSGFKALSHCEDSKLAHEKARLLLDLWDLKANLTTVEAIYILLGGPTDLHDDTRLKFLTKVAVALKQKSDRDSEV